MTKKFAAPKRFGNAFWRGNLALKVLVGVVAVSVVAGGVFVAAKGLEKQKGGRSSGCATGWQEYQNDNFGYKFKIPSGWSDDSIDEQQSETLSRRRLVSTLYPEQQLDSKYKLSIFEILASTSDLKTSDYSAWFDVSDGSQQKSATTFKGIAAEKYTSDIQMPCASQTETMVFCPHHKEMYYFSSGSIYYYISLGIYTTPDVKVGNEATVQCFLDNFELLNQGEGGGSGGGQEQPAGLIPCPVDLYSTSEELVEQAENWWEKTNPCESLPEQKVCGYVKSTFDNGETGDSHTDYRNVNCYCGFFDKSGTRVLRGTKMTSLGYKDGACEE